MKKDLYKEYFEDKKVTVLGLGLLGRGIGDTIFLMENKAEVICTDTRSAEKLAASIVELKKHDMSHTTLVIGENRLSDFEKADYVLTCTGLPVDYDMLIHARSKNIPVLMSGSFVCQIIKEKLKNVKIIGITGTRGKSTTTAMIAHILKENNKKVHLGGNVRGVANLPILEDIEDGDFLVMELDSWQLQNFGEQKISPDFAIFTSFLDDHMNYYKNDREAYFYDKANIFKYQKESCLIASSQAAVEIKKRLGNQEVIIPEKRSFEINLIGDHNQVSAGLSLETCLKVGIPEDSILKALSTFKAVDGRLEFLGEAKGVKFYNDNNATSPDAVMAGLSAVVQKYNRKPILIIGGADKGLELESLEKSILENSKEVVFLEGTGTSKLNLEKKYIFEKLEDCTHKAFEMAITGDVILYSPGFASFSPYFRNEYEKNDEFVRVVSDILKNNKNA